MKKQMTSDLFLLLFSLQFLYQIYSVVLGLEVLGNPVGFLRGLTEGTIGLFYQPIQVCKPVCILLLIKLLL